MTPELRIQKIESYGNAYEALVAAVGKFPREIWQFRDEHGCWSIHEHVVHIADSEANSYVRCRPADCGARTVTDGLRRKPMGIGIELPWPEC